MEGTSPNLSPIKRQSSEVIETNKKFMVYLLVAFNVTLI